jgi:oligopeptidase B
VGNNPPKAKKQYKTLVLHNILRRDPYFWLKDFGNSKVKQLLKKEQLYYEQNTSSRLSKSLEKEMLTYVPTFETGGWKKFGKHYYYYKIAKVWNYKKYYRAPILQNKSVFPLHQRQKLVKEELIIDFNKLAKDQDYFDIGDISISPDERYLAYSCDYKGDETYDLYVRDLKHHGAQKLIAKKISNSLAWSLDSQKIYYLKADNTYRPYNVIEFDFKTGKRRSIYKNQDKAFYVSVENSVDLNYVIIICESETSSYCYILDPTANELTLFKTPAKNRKYLIDHGPIGWVMLSNDNNPNYDLFIRYEKDSDFKKINIKRNSTTRLVDFMILTNSIVLQLRNNGRSEIRVISNTRNIKTIRDKTGINTILKHNVGLTDTCMIKKTGFLLPPCEFEISPKSSKRLSRYWPPKDEFVESFKVLSLNCEKKGLQIPITLVCRKDLDFNNSGPQPLILEAYGAYEISLDPWFDPGTLTLLNNGVNFALAHIRGGGELGYFWYKSAVKSRKINSINDFISVAEFLIESGYTSSDKLAIRGASAAGIVIGGAINRKPKLFKAAVMEVPFVDCLTTMCDKNLPLTVHEYDEWGNPEKYVSHFKSILKFSPYDNIPETRLPNLLVTLGTNDTRVKFHEPLKYVQKIRDQNNQNKVLLMVERGGHHGMSGRLAKYNKESKILSFIIKELTFN